MENGPFKNAVEALDQGVIKEVYTTYKIKDGFLERATVTRDHKVVGGDYHDTTTTERLVKVDEKK